MSLTTKTDIVSEKNTVREIQGAIRFDNVSFVYPDTGIKAIKQFNLSVKAGETVAILGTTGSGKSTVASLLTRLYDPTEGENRTNRRNHSGLYIKQPSYTKQVV